MFPLLSIGIDSKFSSKLLDSGSTNNDALKACINIIASMLTAKADLFMNQPALRLVFICINLSFFRRRERDSNPRVVETVDFESTAIPGYAISAVYVKPVGFWS